MSAENYRANSIRRGLTIHLTETQISKNLTENCVSVRGECPEGRRSTPSVVAPVCTATRFLSRVTSVQNSHLTTSHHLELLAT